MHIPAEWSTMFGIAMVVLVVLAVWKKSRLAMAAAWLILGFSGLPEDFHHWIPYAYTMPRDSYRIMEMVFVLFLFAVPAILISLRVAAGWWVAVCTAGVLAIVAPILYLAQMRGSGASAGIVVVPLAAMYVLVFLPCFIALLVNSPQRWRRSTSETRSDGGC